MRIFSYIIILLGVSGCLSAQKNQPIGISASEIYNPSVLGEQGIHLRQVAIEDFFIYVRRAYSHYGAVFLVPGESETETYIKTGKIIPGKPRIEVGTGHFSETKLAWTDTLTGKPSLLVSFNIVRENKESAVIEWRIDTMNAVISKVYFLKRETDGKWKIEKMMTGAT